MLTDVLPPGSPPSDTTACSQPAATEAHAAAATARLRVHVGCTFEYATAPGAQLLLLVEPRPDGEGVRLVRSSRVLQPAQCFRIIEDPFGNRCWRVEARSDRLLLRYDAVFTTPDAPDEGAPDTPGVAVAALPDETLPFLLPSRYCPSDQLIDEAWQRFGATPDGYARVQAVCDWLHAEIAYSAGASGPGTSALDTLRTRQGVCRDFAQLGVALCRALSIPARYTYGYLPDYGVPADLTPMDFHAWFEAFVGQRWYTFDARHNLPRRGRIKVAHGRDAADVAMVTSYGVARLETMTVRADATRLA